ncbi:allantoinase [Humibacillus sp. DSM 29435]|uniref:allantoinase AllB n=1 Tax=Humibacillus sp. DSM 29435 TaxID=1869167 RepID=UPI0008720361|nr:allantoinase AllB [Humibacillus sp. DSM 29435]OFE18747.1 allantoinase [Humibacillus sp. DSM 29435]
MNAHDVELDVVFRAPRAVIDGREQPASVGVADGRVVVIAALDADLTATTVVELGDDEVLIPGLVDSHVHVNEPGRTEWEGFASATRAAAAGGVTTIIDMPLNSVPATTTVDALETKRAVAAEKAFVDVGFWGGAVPGNVPDLEGLHAEGVFGFKCFTLPSGVDEFEHLEPEQLEEAMRETARLGAMMIVHAEDNHTIDHAAGSHDDAGDTAPAADASDGRAYTGFLHSRPRGAENLAIANVIELSRWLGARAHILHLSSSDALPMIASARADGVPLTVETCPHYLTFTAEEVPDGATEFKCCPPIREASNRELIWGGLSNGTIDIVVTDHSPCTADLKQQGGGDFGVAWGGVAGLQLGLAATWTGAKARGIDLAQVIAWMATGPADLVGLTTKGRIAVGAQADLAVFAPDDSFTVDVRQLHHKNPVSAYAGSTLSGVVRQTWLNGIRLAITPNGADKTEDDTEDAATQSPQGRLLKRGEA